MSDIAMLSSSGYERREGDAYYTEPWVTRALLDNWSIRSVVWEPAAGRGDMVNVMRDRRLMVISTDISTGAGFLKSQIHHSDVCSIVTNPPYNLAPEFVYRAVSLMEAVGGQVAMLLRNEWDSADTRRELFERPDFACKLVLTKRPRWDWWERDKPKASPRHNFAWFIWDGQHKGPPTIRWAP